MARPVKLKILGKTTEFSNPLDVNTFGPSATAHTGTITAASMGNGMGRITGATATFDIASNAVATVSGGSMTSPARGRLDLSGIAIFSQTARGPKFAETRLEEYAHGIDTAIYGSGMLSNQLIGSSKAIELQGLTKRQIEQSGFAINVTASGASSATIDYTPTPTAGENYLTAGAQIIYTANARTFGKGDDEITGTRASDAVALGGGDDWLKTGAHNDAAIGQRGNDSIWGQGGDDVLGGGAGADRLYGGAGNDNLSGNGGRDTILGGKGDDVMGGGGGADVLRGQAGNDNIQGQGGNDKLYGNGGDDVLSGDAGNDTLYGHAGNDSAAGKEGNDVLYGGDGNDTMDGGAGDDIVYGGAGNDQIWGSDGNDTLKGGTGEDTLDGGDGNDLLDQSTSTAGTLIEGGAGNDTLIGGTTSIENSYNILKGGAGDDLIDSTKGTGSIEGGDGNDTIRGSNQRDVIDGGAGNDMIYAGGGSTSSVHADHVEGGAGNDTIQGGANNGRLFGGDGNDRLISDKDGDELSGEAGADVFDFALLSGAGSEVEIMDFTINEDRLRLTQSQADQLRDKMTSDYVQFGPTVTFDDGSIIKFNYTPGATSVDDFLRDALIVG